VAVSAECEVSLGGVVCRLPGREVEDARCALLLDGVLAGNRRAAKGVAGGGFVSERGERTRLLTGKSKHIAGDA